jgi:Ca-activated chloride channel homolog
LALEEVRSPISTLVVSLFSLAVQGSTAQQGTAPASPKQDLSGATISVNVELVALNATVRNGKGGFVSGLHKQDFRVYEDGRLQTIRLFQHEDVPVAVGLVVDNSGSMKRKRTDVAAAALAFVRLSNPEDEMFILNFNENVAFGLPNTKLFSARPSELVEALMGVPARGRTALYDAIEAGLVHLRKARRNKQVLIVISDGGDNASKHTLDQVLQDAGRSDAMIYTIGLFDEYDKDRNPRVLKRIARVTGGEAFLPAEASAVVNTCQSIARDIRNQYTIGYAPENQDLDGVYRQIRVSVAGRRGGKMFVRTRDGYIASPGRNSQTAGAQGDLR